VLIIKDVTERTRLEERLRQAQEDWENTFNSITDMVTVHDGDYNIIEANKAAKALLHLPLLQPDRDRKCFRCYHGAARPPADCPSCECGRTGRPALFEIYEPHLGMFIEIRAIPRFDGKGRQIGLVHIVRDITDRKRAQLALETHSRELTELTSASNRLLSLTRSADIYQEVCAVLHRVFGLKLAWIGTREEGSEEVRPAAHAGDGRGYLDDLRVTWDHTPQGNGPGGRAIRTGLPVVMTVDDPGFAPWRAAAQARGFVSALATPLIAAGRECIGVIVCYSGDREFFTPDRVKLCQVFANQATTAIENARLVNGLEQMVDDRTRQLSDANTELTALNRELDERRQEAEAASRSKSGFLANMSHELRTPLNAIMGFTDLLRMNLAGPVTEKQAEFLRDINSSAGHLLSLINDILDLSKVEAGKLEVEAGEFSVRDLVESTMVLFKERALKHAIRVSVDLDAGIGPVTADQRKVKQVLANLLSNAFKFTPDGGEVRVSARRVARAEGTGRSAVEFSVADTGIGIAPEHLERLFQPFQQVDTSLTRRHSGTGLGLSLSRRLVELHGGTIGVRSEPGKGSVFTFTLPQ
jgi:signal transduction histidine kinase